MKRRYHDRAGPLPLACPVLLLLIGALAGCAGTQTQPADFAQAQASIDQAEQADAQRYASSELNMARQKLEQARDAQQDGEEEEARRLARQAMLDAELAAASAENQETQASVRELQNTLDTLREELRRGQQQTQQ